MAFHEWVLAFATIGLFVATLALALFTRVLARATARLHELERLRQDRELHHSDRIRVFEPLLREIEKILRAEYRVDEGGSIWSYPHSTEEFRNLLDGGLLRDKRHDPLRGDVKQLLDLEREHQARQSAFSDAMGAAIGEVLAESKALGRGAGATWITGRDLVDAHGWAEDLRHALAVGDRDRWANAIRTRWADFNPGPETWFTKASFKVKESREAYRLSARSLLDQGAKIRDGLNDAIHRQGAYLWSTSVSVDLSLPLGLDG